MDTRTCRRKQCGFATAVFAWLLALPALPLQARVLEMDVERVSTAIGRIDGLRLRIDWPDAGTGGILRLDMDALDAGELGYRYRGLRWECPLQHESTTHFRCEGKLRARGQGTATLVADWTDGALALSLGAARGQFALAFPAAGAEPIRVTAVRMPTEWLQPLLASRWKDGKLTAGTLDSTLELRSIVGDGITIAGPLAVSALGVDSADGRIAAAALDASGRLALQLRADATVVELDLDLHGGELLAGPMYASLPESPITFGTTMRSTTDTGWSIERLHWKDPGVLELVGTGTIDGAAEAWLQTFDGSLAMPALRVAHARYLDTLLGTLGLARLDIDGAVQLQFAMREGRAVEFELGATAVEARDDAGRFALQGLDGRLRWTRAAAPVEGQLGWKSASIYEVDLGAATLPLRSAGGGLSLRGPVSLAVLGGSLAVSRFAWQPADDAKATAALDIALELDRLDLAELSKALDWPPFVGTLSGRIPGVRYADEVLTLDGGLSVDVFDGNVEIASMTLERPFGVAPTMTAEIGFSALDLKPLTGAFGFGEITGRLDGQVRDLRLVDWSPVAFDADLHTSPGAKGPRRISQRAVNDLSRVGGAGIVAGLQTQVLKLFETFGYSRIGLKCRLANNVCRMDGVDSSGDGYTIVEGSGLPRITVIGHQRQVDWPVLVARLKAATEGQTPIVE